MATLIHQLLHQAVEAGASDLLLSAGTPPALRVDGELRLLEMAPLEGQQITTCVEVFASVPQREHWRRARHLDFSGEFEGHRLRGSASWAGGEATLALRVLPASVPQAGQLGVPKAVVDLLNRPWGLLLVTGPAGHGKTTTCASLLDILNRRETKHIVTVEDPVEYKHRPVRCLFDQQEVGYDTPSFAAALKQVVRHNPDVLMIGEIRDRESVEAALNVAETGHLVLTTMHANDSVQALDRIASFFPRDQQPHLWGQLSLSLAAVVNQRLIRGAKGGRVMASEVLMNTLSVSNLIREGRTGQLHSALESEQGHGSQSMNASLKSLVDAGRLHVVAARAHLNPLETDLLPAPGQ